jgi:ABC-type nitrate/sulfonate/bicarbonate transport system substrate-binding protein
MPVSDIDRRTMLRGMGLGALLLSGGGALAACSSSASSSSSASVAGATAAAAKNFGPLNFRLDWIKYVEFAGEFIADSNGYYKAEGFSSVNLMAGGASAVPAETDVVQGKALAGLSTPPLTGAAVAAGAPLKIIGAAWQKNPYCIVYLQSKPISNPQAMIGKRIGVQAANISAWHAFLTANNISPSQLTTVPVQSDPTELTSGTVDGWYGFITDEPIELQQKGYKVGAFLLADYHYPLVAQTILTRTDTIQSNPDALKALLRAEIQGWKGALNSPTLGAKLSVNVYGTNLGLDYQTQILSAYAENQLVVSADTKKNGIFTMTPELIAANIATLNGAGIKVTADQLFDLSLVNEVYQEDPSLITSGIPAVLPTK